MLIGKEGLEVVQSSLYLKKGLLPVLDHVNPLSTLLFFESQLSHAGILQL